MSRCRMRRPPGRRPFLFAWLLGMPLAVPGAAATGQATNTPPAALVPVVVTARGSETLLTRQAGNTARLDSATVERVRATHPAELLLRAPGTWISRGSGQEHLTAIRSPVLSGPGSCGAFLMAENGLSIRPAGFCNVNQLLELNLEQADAVEVIRGPGSALYGSNALHGLINALVGTEPAQDRLLAELGQDGYRRASLDLGAGLAGGRFRALVNLTDDRGWRDHSGYSQQKLNLSQSVGGEGERLGILFSATRLDQQTAGFITGEDAYRDEDASRANPNPEAFREARAERLAGRWRRELAGGGELGAAAILRHSRMEFSQHFLPGQPLERNGQQSAGLSLAWRARSAVLAPSLGLDLEVADGFLREVQDQPITEGSEFLQATRPAGLHYDFQVLAYGMAPYVQLDWQASESLTLSAGLRYEYQRYEYDNLMLDGDTDQDGNPCGFGGCLFYRPADRKDSFGTLAPKLGLLWQWDAQRQFSLGLNRGFRAPQATELYRLQSGQAVADLDAETLDALEAGMRLAGRGLFLDLAAFAMRKQHFIFRDSEGFNVSDGKTSHRGLEIDLTWVPHPGWTLGVNGSWARHRYEFDRLAAQGERIAGGSEVDTAPRTLGSVRLAWRYAAAAVAELEWWHLGDYFLDAANAHSYPGHDLLNLRVTHGLNRNWSVGLGITNVADADYAERADFAFGNYRYFPGRGRAWALSLEWRPGVARAGGPALP